MPVSRCCGTIHRHTVDLVSGTPPGSTASEVLHRNPDQHDPGFLTAFLPWAFASNVCFPVGLAAAYVGGPLSTLLGGCPCGVSRSPSECVIVTANRQAMGTRHLIAFRYSVLMRMLA